MVRDKKKQLGILGGTFDPIHCGHLILAEQLKEKLKLQKVIFVPSANPPHKENNPISSAKDRLKMVKIAIRDNPDFLVSDLELKRGGKSYTIDTLTLFRKLYKESKLFFLLGSDAIDELPTWKKPEQIFRKVKVAIALRPRFDNLDPENRFVKKSLVVPINGLDISSSQIREKVRKRKSLKYLVPMEVEKFIRSHKLYRS
ncbi:MAG TPA: nicotinate-nucleotide adenylyltransferase [Terriglobales bacterium]|nr:nicotinate-nucleotide adenylyltransferase [Terriglobales bacterium]